MPNLATLLIVGSRKCHQSISRPKIWGYTNFGVSIFIFLGNKGKKYISGNTAMPNLATLLMVGFRKYHHSIPRPRKHGYANF